MSSQGKSLGSQARCALFPLSPGHIKLPHRGNKSSVDYIDEEHEEEEEEESV